MKEGDIIKIQTISEKDLAYPDSLNGIYKKPQRLYVLGDVENLRRKCITIVGTRNCSKYGAEASKRIAYCLAKNNYVIVSGLAKGIDTFAHIGALNAHGRTIAVLAHGLNEIYPRINTELAKKILYNGGTIITEFELNTPIVPKNFIQRNRIISGLSSATIVVEAGKKSGALITANFALEQGKEVFAVPGSIQSRYSMGTNELIKNGAQILYSNSICNII